MSLRGIPTSSETAIVSRIDAGIDDSRQSLID